MMTKGTLEQGWGVDQMFIIKRMGQKVLEKKRSVCGFYRFGKAYYRVNRIFVADVENAQLEWLTVEWNLKSAIQKAKLSSTSQGENESKFRS